MRSHSVFRIRRLESSLIQAPALFKIKIFAYMQVTSVVQASCSLILETQAPIPDP